MQKEIEDFCSLFTLTPNISILDLNVEFKDMTQILNDLVEPVSGTITTINTSKLNEIRAKAKRSNYDYGVISNQILQQDDKYLLMKLISMAIRDSGYIVILEQKEKDTSAIYKLLEEFDYGAVSCIDIFSNYSLIIGKKLHMWGMD